MRLLHPLWHEPGHHTICTHRLPQFWQDPEVINPERFTPTLTDPRPRYAYIPFGGGPRLCIGKTFALQEMTLILPILLQSFRFELDPAWQVRRDPVVSLRECLAKTHYVIPAEEDPFSIAGLYWHGTNDQTYRFVASDGHRLAFVESTSNRFAGIPIGEGIIIPRKGVHEMLRLLDVNPTFELAIHENCLIMKTTDSILTMRLLEDEFPEYQQIIPEERPIAIHMDRQALVQALRRIATLTSQKYRHVRLTAKPRVLLLESGNPEEGDASDEIDVDFDGPEFGAAFSIRYLVDAIECMHSRTIRFEWVDSNHGGIVSGDEDPGYVALIMPMIL